jgi:hypothetical protein
VKRPICAVTAVLVAQGCSSTPVSVPLRSLERSGGVAFVCVAEPGSTSPGRPIEQCHPLVAPAAWYDYSVPHLIGLVTQTARGEVAVVDTTAALVVDQDPGTPGESFIPVGQAPTDIASTSAGTATFVTVADANQPGIFALPTARILPSAGKRPLGLTSFPSCSLPAYPGRMVIVDDPALPPPPSSDVPADAQLLLEAQYGTPKLLVTFPDLGEIAVIDAQAVLAIPDGRFDACPTERFRLRGANGIDPRPGAMAYRPDDGRLFIADERAPIIHVLEASSPGALVEREPLLATSAVDPSRVVTTSAVAVSPQTLGGKRYVYAVDFADSGSIMVFDVSDDASARTPLSLGDPKYLPYAPPDRIALGVPAQGVAFARHDLPVIDTGAVGSTRAGERCKPDDPNDVNRAPVPTYAGPGAGPYSLRGVFGFAVLNDGRLAVIDVDDLDANCRRPQWSDATQLGCSGQVLSVDAASYPAASDEVSCRVVQPHRVRAARYFTNGGDIRNAPLMQSVPLLYDADGTVLSVDPDLGGNDRPRMLGPNLETSPDDKRTKTFVAAIGGGVTSLDQLSPFPYEDGGHLPASKAEDPSQAIASVNWTAFDLFEPRAHYDQTWSVVYEGEVPGFGGHLGSFQCSDATRFAVPNGPDTCEAGDSPAGYVLSDSSGAFCSYGVEGADLAAQTGIGTGDILAIADALPDAADPYWSAAASVCSFEQCRAVFGVPEAVSNGARERTVRTAYQNRLLLDPKPVGLPITCCFPYPVTYKIRGGGQWIVTGSTTGFGHHVQPDPKSASYWTAPCVRSADENVALRNARARTLTHADAKTPPGWDDPRLFRNAQIRFGIWEPPKPCDGCIISRGMLFTFQESGGFSPMVLPLSSSSLVLPQGIRYIDAVDRLAIPDAMAQGLLMFSLDRVAVSESYL